MDRFPEAKYNFRFSPFMCAAISPGSPPTSTNDHSMDDKIEQNNPTDKSQPQQPAFLHSFEAELDKVDAFFETRAPDVRKAILASLQRMYNQNEWHDNPLTVICRDLDIHVPTSEQLTELKEIRDALKTEYDALRQAKDIKS